MKARLKLIGKDPDYADERAALQEYSTLLDTKDEIKERLKEAKDDLEAKLDAKYPTLSEDEIKRLVVDDKWLDHLAASVHNDKALSNFATGLQVMTSGTLDQT